MFTSSKLHVLMAVVLMLVMKPCAAQQLWHGTSKGMTQSQVRSVVDGVTAVKVSSQMHGGALGLLKVPEVIMGGNKYAATFYFLRGGLDEV